LARTSVAYVGDGQWHHFGPQLAPATRASASQTVALSQASTVGGGGR
jgi:hypothetical protein